MKAALTSFLFAVSLITACGNSPFSAKNGAVTSNTNSTADSASKSANEKAADESVDESASEVKNTETNYMAFALGTTIVEVPKDWEKAYYVWTTYNLIDESAQSSWESEVGEEHTSNQVFVFELAEKTLLKKFVLDSKLISSDEKPVKDFKIEISDVSKTEGFQEIVAAALALKQDNQTFNVAKPVAGRWVRVTLKNNFGSKDRIELNEIRGYGEQLTGAAKLENLSGTYQMASGVGKLHIKQEGTSVVGCYDYRRGILSGGTENRLLKANLTEIVDDETNKKENFIGLFSFSGEGKQVIAFLRDPKATEGYRDQWSGAKISNDVGECAQFEDLNKANGGAASQLKKDLADDGRAVLYGINFDFNSDKLREESKTVLNQIVAVLKENNEWKMTVEGHTDNIGGDVFNKNLSEKRAVAVKAFLTGAGIDANRLSAAGMGMSKPVAANETEAGRAQNRRVELVKQ